MNYNSFYNKPTLNHKELIGDIKASDIGGMTEEDMQELLETDLTPYYNKDEIDDLFARSFVYREKSGHIVTFDCPSTSQSIPEVTVGIEATQDLHGYDYSWPAGGGKNKFKTDFENTTINGTTITKTSDGRVLTSGVPTSAFDFVIGHVSLPAGSYILNGCPANGGNGKYRLQVTDYPVVNNLGQDYGSGVSFTLEHDMEIAVRIQVYTEASATLEYKPMIRLASVTDATFAPYANICPISGWSAVNVYDGPTTDPQDATVYTTALKDANDQPLTCYGGQLENVNGVQTLTVTHANIASYNGETINEPWVSSMDVYSSGATPTTGAQVVYPLTTPTEIPQQSQAISTQDGTNNLWADSGDVEIKCLDRIIPAGE